VGQRLLGEGQSAHLLYVLCAGPRPSFIRGSALKDPRGLLEGNGQYVRHVKVRTPSDIDEDVFKAFLRQASR